MCVGQLCVMAWVDYFIEAPSKAFLNHCTKDQLLKIADHYKIDAGDKRLKDNVKGIIRANLFDTEVLKPPNLAGVSVKESRADLALNFEQQKEMLILKMQLEKERDLELERLRRIGKNETANRKSCI